MADKLHVLIVEDELNVRDLIRAVLKQYKDRVEIHEASNLGEARSVVDELPRLHIAFLDTNFPGEKRTDLLPGVEIFEHLRKRHPDASVVAMSGTDMPAWKDRDVQARLPKPFPITDVMNAVLEHGFKRHGIPHEEPR